MNIEIIVALITVAGSIIAALISKASVTRHTSNQPTQHYEPTTADPKQAPSAIPPAGRPIQQQSTTGVYFLLAWVCICLAAWTLAWTLGILLAPNSPTVSNLISGLIVGLAQWYVLKDILKESGWWVLATASGSIMAGLTFAGLGFAGYSVFGFFLANVIGGISAGTAQWLILQRQVARAGHWIVVSAAAWAIAGTIGNYIAFTGGGIIIGGLICGLLIGVITGSQLVLLIEHSR